MSDTKRLCLSSRYIHTGNSGVTFQVVRDVERVNRAEVFIENGAFGAFSTVMEIRGNDCYGMTSHQLRDLALMFMDAAAELDSDTAQFERSSPDIVQDDGTRRRSTDLPRSLEKLIPIDFGGIVRNDAEEPSDSNLAQFFSLLQTERSRKNKSISEGIPDSKKGQDREELLAKQTLLKLGYRALMARRLLLLSGVLSASAETDLYDYHLATEPKEPQTEEDSTEYSTTQVLQHAREALNLGQTVLVIVNSKTERNALNKMLPEDEMLTYSTKQIPGRRFDKVLYHA